MPNMSYCRFENTSNDLDDCLEHIEDALDSYEHRAREKLIETCKAILEQLGADVDMDSLEYPEENKGREECENCGEMTDIEDLKDGLCPDCLREITEAEKNEKE
jgi:ribosomal protein S14